MFQFRYVLFALAFCLAASVLLVSPASASVVSASSPLSSRTCGTWQIQKSANPEVISFFNGVTAISPQNMWAVGGHNDFLNTHHLTLAEQSRGGRWRTARTVNVSSTENELFSTSAISASDIWAVGIDQSGNTPGQTLIENWNGSGWQVIPSPNVNGVENVLVSVSASSANDVWAVGYTEQNLSNYQTLTEHWDGSAWSIVPSPNVGSIGSVFSAVVALAPNNAWAVGDDTLNFASSQTLVEHWDGTQWSVVTSPSIASQENQLSSISALSANDIWAAGSATNNTTGGVQTLIEQWNGSTWSIIPSPNPSGSQPSVDGLQGIAAVSATDVWAVGYSENASGTLQTLSEQWNGTQWSTVTSPDKGTGENQLKGIARVPGSNKVVAVGIAYAPNFSQTDTLVMIAC
jgi:hypothetical protein